MDGIKCGFLLTWMWHSTLEYGTYNMMREYDKENLYSKTGATQWTTAPTGLTFAASFCAFSATYPLSRLIWLLKIFFSEKKFFHHWNQILQTPCILKHLQFFVLVFLCGCVCFFFPFATRHRRWSSLLHVLDQNFIATVINSQFDFLQIVSQFLQTSVGYTYMIMQTSSALKLLFCKSETFLFDSCFANRVMNVLNLQIMQLLMVHTPTTPLPHW